MTNSSDRSDRSDRGGERRPTSLYTRFIPREELSGFASWQPGNFGDDPERRPRSAPPQPDPEALRRQAEEAERERLRQIRLAAERAEADRITALEQARQAGYQDGYRDGLSALESFKVSFTAQTTAQVSGLVQRMQAQFDAIEQDLARRVAGIALEIARQVVRSELHAQPDAVVAVTQEALGLLLNSARHVTLRVNPQDHEPVAAGCAEALSARGVHLIADAGIEPGGCLVESSIGEVDARVATRWARATAALGHEAPWDAEEQRS
jgi:flagellar assembly protein FliH